LPGRKAVILSSEASLFGGNVAKFLPGERGCTPARVGDNLLSEAWLRPFHGPRFHPCKHLSLLHKHEFIRFRVFDPVGLPNRERNILSSPALVQFFT